jgi:hypothetical protein
MKSKVLNFLLLVTSLLGYLNWSGNNHIFLFKAEVEVISKLFKDPVSVIHPITLIPLIGQLILFITLFQNKPNKVLTLLGISGIGILLYLLFIIGLISSNFLISISSVPFVVLSIYTIRFHHNTKE